MSKNSITQNMNKKEEGDFILIKSLEGSYIKVKKSEIVWLESYNVEVTIHMNQCRSFAVFGSLSTFEHLLGEKDFIRCHQNYIVNMNYVQSIEDCLITNTGSRIRIKNKEIIQIKNHFVKFLHNKPIQC